MDYNKPIKIGFIGAGDISVLHAQAIRDIPCAELAGLDAHQGYRCGNM